MSNRVEHTRITIDYIGYDDLLYHITFDGSIEEKEVMAELDWLAGSAISSFCYRDFQRINTLVLAAKLELKHGPQA